MRLISKRGEFDSFQQLRAAYIKAPDANEFWFYPGPNQGEWDNSALHASDVGSCPRAVLYRLRGVDEKPRSSYSAANREVMFWSGHVFHALDRSALNWAGLLVAWEKPLTLPFGVKGSCDVLFLPNYKEEGIVLKDTKTVLPNALKDYAYTLPKENNCLQVGAYSLAEELADLPILCGVIEYTDRAGSNTPKVCEVDLGEWGEKARRALVDLHSVSELAPENVACPPPVYKGHYKRGDRWTLDGITYEPDWRCGYCDYHLTIKERRVNPNSGRLKEHGWTSKDSLCKPYNLPPLDVAKVEGGRLTKVKAGHEEGVEQWFRNARRYYDVENGESE